MKGGGREGGNNREREGGGNNEFMWCVIWLHLTNLLINHTF